MNVIDSLPMIVYLAAAVVVTRIPYVRTYLSICYTLLFEVIRVLIGGGNCRKVRLLKDDSMSENAAPVTLKHDLISYVSYTGITLFAIGLFYLVSTNRYHSILYIFIGLIAVSIVFWIRHFLEFLWALSFISLLVLPIYWRYEIAVMPIAIFLASYIFIQSVFNAFYVCRQSLANRKRKGMAAKIKWIPSILIGLCLLGQSFIAGYFIVSKFVLQTGFPWGYPWS